MILYNSYSAARRWLSAMSYSKELLATHTDNRQLSLNAYTTELYKIVKAR